MSKKYKVNIGFISQKIGDDVTIFSGEESILHTLNETAAYIFQGIKLGWEDEKIIAGLMSKFGASQNQAEKDLADFTKVLLQKKIIMEKK